MIDLMEGINLPSPSGGVTLNEAIATMMRAKSIANLRPQYLKGLSRYLRQFAAGRECVPVSSLDVCAVEAWFAERGERVATMASNIGRLSSLFSFCERRGWISRNPCRMLERPRFDRKPPRILTPSEAHRLLSVVRQRRPHMLPFFVLAMLAGVRPDEISRLSWESVDRDRGLVTIDAAASKVRRRRIVHLEPCALALLKRGGRLPVSRATRKRYQAFGCAVLGLTDWPQDLLRHTAASYLLALHRDAGRVALSLGNSPGILLRHYQELVTPEACAEFWACPVG
jgi:integrase